MATAPELLTTDGVVKEGRNLVESYVKAEVIEITEPETGVKALVIRSGNSVTPLAASVFDSYRDEPRHRHGTATMLSLDSLIEHVNRFRDTDSMIFADDSREKPSITAVLDYHHAGGAIDGAPARFGKHRSVYAFPVSDEWKAWQAKNAEPMGMADFAAFLEERIIDVLYIIPGEDSLPEDVQRLVDTLGGGDPVATPNKLMELARGLQVNESAIVQEAVNLSSGEGVVRFQASHTDEAGAPLKVPSLFLIGIPVFNNGPLYRIAARLRYRKNGGRITFWYELWRTDRTFDHAFNEAVERVRIETETPVLIGKPEA
jgi:post-segregation antitoxin (ccd killing protein)